MSPSRSWSRLTAGLAAAVFAFALGTDAAKARPIGGLWGGSAAFSFNTYDFGEFNREVFFLNARELFGSSLSALDPVRWGNGFGGTARYGLTRRIFVEFGVERLEARSVGGVFSLTQTVLVELNASLWTGRLGLLYAYPIKWGTHINFGVLYVPAYLRGKFEIQDSLSEMRFTKFAGLGHGVEFIVAEPEFFILSQSLRITFGYRQLILPSITVSEVDAATAQERIDNGLEPSNFVLTRSQAPREQSDDPLPINYSGVFARLALTVNFGKGR